MTATFSGELAGGLEASGAIVETSAAAESEPGLACPLPSGWTTFSLGDFGIRSKQPSAGVAKITTQAKSWIGFIFFRPDAGVCSDGVLGEFHCF